MAENIINQLINEINISDVVGKYIDLKKKGKNYWGVCPFHEDNNPSMSISNEKRIFKCFVCGAGGNAINFISDFEEVPFGKALNKLANIAGIEIDNKYDLKPKYNEKQQELINALNDANNFFQYSLSTEEGSKSLEYLKSRNLEQKDIDKYKIGFAPEEGLLKFLKEKGHSIPTLINASLITERESSFFRNRVMFAITNEFGDVVGFSGRTMSNDSSKYINSVESIVFNKSEILYNLYLSNDSIMRKGEVIITEGFMDVIALAKVNFRNVVAVMGTALTAKHIPKLKNKIVILMFDADKAGLNATEKSLNLLFKNKIKTRVVYNKTNKDPDDILNQDGKEVLVSTIENQKESSEFMYALLKKKYNPNNPSEIETFIKSFSKLLVDSSIIEKEFYANKISKEFNLGKETILGLIPKTKNVYQPNVAAAAPKIKFEKTKGPNQSYKLIRSMLKNPNLIKFYKGSSINWNDIVLVQVGHYIIDKYDGKNVVPSAVIRGKIKEIMEDSPAIVSKENEFKDLMELVNNVTKKSYGEDINVKLKNTKDESQQIRLLNTKRKFKKEGK